MRPPILPYEAAGDDYSESDLTLSTESGGGLLVSYTPRTGAADIEKACGLVDCGFIGFVSASTSTALDSGPTVTTAADAAVVQLRNDVVDAMIRAFGALGLTAPTWLVLEGIDSPIVGAG